MFPLNTLNLLSETFKVINTLLMHEGYILKLHL